MEWCVRLAIHWVSYSKWRVLLCLKLRTSKRSKNILLRFCLFKASI